MQLKFLGASQTVTGSCYFLSTNKTGLLVDYGMFQGKPEEMGLNSVKPDIEFHRLSAVVLTHAHLDHCGRLPMLVNFGFKGPVFMTEATKALAELVLFDAAKISKEDNVKAVLYTDEDVMEILKQVVLVEYDKPFSVGDFRITFIDAGHILGSSSIVVEETQSKKKIVFSGDLGNTPEPLLFPTQTVNEADIAVIESTYGDEVHERREEIEDLTEIVKQAERDSGTVLIPSFSLQRSQELLYIFDGLKKSGVIKNDLPVFLDSPMAIRATTIFKDFPELYSKPLKLQAKTDDPFDFPSLVICDTIEKSKQIKNVKGPKVIIAGSGMMSGGRIIHHAINFLGDPKTQLIFVGYQAEGTMGRDILNGRKIFNIWGNTVEVKAQIKEIKTMSSHADQDQLLSWLKKIKGLTKVILVHGEELPRLVLTEKIRQELPEVEEIILPVLHQEIDLDKVNE
ncbi:MAG: RNA-metabolising metallo-beta-lactamase, metallo-beta-lactamase family protein [Microgenomates group bacterium GW2011_GWC1_44_9]|nr:MAG: RNA-metabolising metallo-beta-lactamase, metallo-beta-lactamase family protein [Microgenomates group bacterium GW2011_GWC1_44_9]